jgi:predicted amidohydrolase YtcJ
VSSLFLRNASIWTGDSARPWADCAVIERGRFAFVGRESDALPPSAARVIDGRERLVLPGLTDAHVHLLGTGEAMRSIDLKDVPSEDEAARRVAERAAQAPAGAWVRGAGWDQHLWPGGRFPTKASLDAVAPEHPVVLVHTSGHCIWVNDLALREAGVTRETQAPVGGAIELGEDGEPTGVLRDAASRLVTDVMPRPSQGDREDALREALPHAHRLGVTSVHAMDVGAGELAAMRSLAEGGELSLRTRVYLTARRLDEWITEGLTSEIVRPQPEGWGMVEPMLRIGGIKFFADGALGSMTAWMLGPYEGSDEYGLPLQPVEQLEEQVGRCLRAGLVPAVHAIGDRANREVLDLLERLRDVRPDVPRRIEHAQLLTHEDIPRFAELGVAVSAQPIHATQDMAKVDRHWGDRGRFAYPFASLLASGAALAFGSDSPVETMDPLAGLHAAVMRRNARGEPDGGWYPDERLSLENALRAYTSGSARPTGEEAGAGRIAEGCFGDFVVLSRDLFEMNEPMEMLQASVEMTVVGGEVVYDGERGGQS